MGGRSTLVPRCALCALCTLCLTAARGVPAQDVTLPAGTRVSVRLLDPVTGARATRGDRVRALVIASAPGLLPGDTVTGVVRDAGVEHDRGRRHFVALAFDRLALRGAASPALPLAARVIDVPNARESVDTAGRVVGPERPGVLRAGANWAAALLGTVEPLAGAVFFAAFNAERIERHRRIEYAPGVEMTLALTRALQVPARPAPPPLPPVPAAIVDALAAAPLRAVTVKERLPADIITVALVGSASDVTNAFTAAGWTAPERSKLRGDIETLAAAARARGFDAQPFTTLLLDGRPPTLAFEKVVNSMVKRHHVRLWPWGDAIEGRLLWLVTATRDDGMRFSRARHAVTHHIDPAIDGERDKVVDDLLAASVVASRSYVDRAPPAGRAYVNDGTTPVTTDWRLAVLVLRTPSTNAQGVVPSGR
jgi:hypothetical protein